MAALVADIVLVVLVACAPAAIERTRGLVHAGSDLAFMFIPHYAWWWSRPRWLGGWNPWIFGGFPSNEDPLLGQVHPFGLLWALCSPLTASALEGAAAPALAGVGMLLYLRRIGCGRLGSLVGALSFAGGGYVHAHAVHPEKLRTALAVPWALVAIEALDGPRLVAGLGTVVGLLVAGGHPQTIAYALPLVAAYALVFGRGRRVAPMAGVTVGIALSAIVWLPAIQLVLRSNHVHTIISGVDHLAAACAHTLVVPFGCGGGDGPFYGHSIEAFPGCGLVDCTGYPGMLVLLMLVAGVPSLLAAGRGRFWVAVGLLGLVLSTGAAERVLAIPGVRAPARALLWWNLAAAAGAALAAGAVIERRAKTVPWWIAVAVLTAVIGWSWTRGVAARRASLGSLGVLATTAAAAGRPSRAWWPVLAVLVVDLVVFGAELHAGVRPDFEQEIHAELARVRDILGGDADVEGMLGRAIAVPAMPGAMWAQLEQVRLLQGWDVLVPAAFSKSLAGTSAPVGYEFGWVQDPALFAAPSHVLDLLRCRVAFVADGFATDRTWTAALAAPRWRAAGETTRWRYFLNTRAMPVAWFVRRERVVSDEDAFRLIRGEAGDYDPSEEALVTASLGIAPASTPGRVTLLAYDDDSIRLHADVPVRSLLVTSELAYPGWGVWIDGTAAEVETVNAGFRGVVVPRGVHEVEFRYRPGLARAGLAISSSALAIISASAALGRRRRRIVPPRPRGAAPS